MAADPHARGVVAARASAWLARFVTVGLAETDLSLPQYRLLAFLADGGTAHADLAQRLTVSGPSVTALVDGLVGRGYVERRKDPDDGRRIAFLLTDDGHDALEAADNAVVACLATLGGHLDEEEAEAAVRGLELVDEAIRRHREAGDR
ncbi:MAG: MarR family transcriptional regulator [Actinobacteria bacterium]|nr:MarR family transcriptional regulator [Actinomycetota bacterium]